jgi:hypothetical protein
MGTYSKDHGYFCRLIFCKNEKIRIARFAPNGIKQIPENTVYGYKHIKALPRLNTLPHRDVM